ncbi:MAG: hypothetical protein U0235_33265 [Polyangiaceae bacterium]
MRRVTVLAVTCALAGGAVGSLACTSLLGLHELAVRDSDASTDDVGVAPPVDAGEDADGCAPRGTSYCAKLCPVPDFCDDFDDETLAFDRWKGAPGLPNQVVTLEGGLALIPDEKGGQALLAMAHSDTSTPAITLLTESMTAPPGAKPRGLRVRVEARLKDLIFAKPEAGPGDQYFYYFAVADPVRGEGIAMVLRDKGASATSLVLQQREISSRGKEIDLARLLNVDTISLTQNWIGIELVLAPPDVLRDLKIPCTVVDANLDPIPDADAIARAPAGGLRIVGRVATESRCVLMFDELATGDWLGRAALAVGATVSDFGTANTRIDNFSASFLY